MATPNAFKAKFLIAILLISSSQYELTTWQSSFYNFKLNIALHGPNIKQKKSENKEYQ